jgi:hypothetical protein
MRIRAEQGRTTQAELCSDAQRSAEQNSAGQSRAEQSRAEQADVSREMQSSAGRVMHSSEEQCKQREPRDAERGRAMQSSRTGQREPSDAEQYRAAEQDNEQRGAYRSREMP